VLISHVINIPVYFPLCPPGNCKSSPKVGNMTNLILYLLLEIAFWIAPNVWHTGCETRCVWICMFYLKWLYYHLSVRIMLQWTIVSSFVRFQVITAASMMTGFWDTAPCIVVEVDRRFRGACCLHRPDDVGSTYLWNICLLRRDYTALYPRNLSCSVSSLFILKYIVMCSFKREV
jgi:hypothetical protein